MKPSNYLQPQNILTPVQAAELRRLIEWVVRNELEALHAGKCSLDEAHAIRRNRRLSRQRLSIWIDKATNNAD
jgi:hypothetical protein